MKAFLSVALVFFALGAEARVFWDPMPPEAYAFGKRYPEAQALLFAFDYGHGLMYERLVQLKGTKYDAKAVEKELLTTILGILKNPPTVKVEEEEIGPEYVYTLPLVIDLFDWSHMLHQFTYDVLGSWTDRGPRMHDRLEKIYERYASDQQLAITGECKTMLFMDGHPFSKAFRRKFPSLNLLIWSYHWLQIKLYEALLPESLAARDTAVAATVKKFRELVSDLPESAEFDMMPTMAQDAQNYTKLHRGQANVFDNLHSLHDVISDLIVSEKVPVSGMRPTGRVMGRMAQDPLAFKCPAKP